MTEVASRSHVEDINSLNFLRTKQQVSKLFFETTQLDHKMETQPWHSLTTESKLLLCLAIWV